MSHSAIEKKILKNFLLVMWN